MSNVADSNSRTPANSFKATRGVKIFFFGQPKNGGGNFYLFSITLKKGFQPKRGNLPEPQNFLGPKGGGTQGLKTFLGEFLKGKQFFLF